MIHGNYLYASWYDLCCQERSLREGNDSRRSQSITELVLIKDREKNLQFEFNQAKDMLKTEKGRVKHYMEQV